MNAGRRLLLEWKLLSARAARPGETCAACEMTANPPPELTHGDAWVGGVAVGMLHHAKRLPALCERHASIVGAFHPSAIGAVLKDMQGG